MFAIDIEKASRELDYSTQPSWSLGRITIGGFTESFHVDLTFWNPRDYRVSWKRALERLLSADVVDSCLIASIGDPESSNFVTCWPLYRRREKVYVQNSIIFLARIAGNFNPSFPWKFIESRQSVDEDGNHVSEWEIDTSEIEQFMQTVNW